MLLRSTPDKDKSVERAQLFVYPLFFNPSFHLPFPSSTDLHFGVTISVNTKDSMRHNSVNSVYMIQVIHKIHGENGSLENL